MIYKTKTSLNSLIYRSALKSPWNSINKAILAAKNASEVSPFITGRTFSTTLDFGDILPQTSADLTFKCKGVMILDQIILGTPVVPAGSEFTSFISNKDQITVRFNNYSSENINPQAGIFTITVKHR